MVRAYRTDKPMHNRQPTKPGRVLVTPEDGSAPFYATVTRADEPTDPGTPYSKATQLSDETAELLGLDPAEDPTVNDAFQRIYAIQQPALYAYDGVNIKNKFKGEMDYTEPWEWIRQRLMARDISGLHIKDYFVLTVKNNSGGDVMLQMQIAGINRELGFADPEITAFHIDFISKGLWPERHAWNKVAYNNGLPQEGCPWLCSDVYAWLNSKKMDVPNATTVNPATVVVDYTTTGVFDKLPSSLQNAIVERYDFAPMRYSNDGLLTDDIWRGWQSIGKLWLPNEVEVYGYHAFSSKTGYDDGVGSQFPIFTDSKTRIKKINGTRYTWLLRDVQAGDASSACCVHMTGFPNSSGANGTLGTSPICFRISG